MVLLEDVPWRRIRCLLADPSSISPLALYSIALILSRQTEGGAQLKADTIALTLTALRNAQRAELVVGNGQLHSRRVPSADAVSDEDIKVEDGRRVDQRSASGGRSGPLVRRVAASVHATGFNHSSQFQW